jgi:PEP-CTERM motif-containing protein
MNRKLILTLSAVVVAALAFSATPSRADALHGFCTNVTCSDNGAITPVPANNPTFGFYDSGGPATGDDLLVFVSPVALTSGQLTVGETNTGSTSGTATLSGSWTTGQLDAFLGLSASPTNPFGNYGGATGLDPGVTSFDVYTLNLGTQTLNDQAGELSNPLFSVSGEPAGLFILDFLTIPGDGTIGTANSAALQIVGGPGGGPPPSVPEPSTLSLMVVGFGGLLGLCAMSRRRLVTSA